MPAVPPEILPEAEEDILRWGEQALRLRILSGDHAEDVQDVLLGMFSGEIADGLAIDPDLSRNTFKLITQDLTTLYLQAPTVSAGTEDLSPISTPRLWSQQGQTEFVVRGLGESLVRMDWPYWNPDASSMTYRVVEPSLVVVTKTDPDDPTIPVALEELRWRTSPETGEVVWTWDSWDVSDKARPTYQILSYLRDHTGARTDLTAVYAPALAEIGYPYLDRSNLPVLPYVLYHKRDTGRVWNWQEGMELVNGTLRLAAFWTQWGDGFRNASHPQRWAMDVDTIGGVQQTVGGVPVEMIPIDRKSILKFRARGEKAQLGQFDPSLDPVAGAEALRIYEAGLAIYAGLSPSDLVVTESQSGRAIEITRQGKRRHQRMLAPMMLRGDQLLLANAARITNRYASTNLPEDPAKYSIQYQSLLPTPEERKVLIDEVKAKLEMGLISRVEALMLVEPSIQSREEAVARLAQIAQTNILSAGA